MRNPVRPSCCVTPAGTSSSNDQGVRGYLLLIDHSGEWRIQQVKTTTTTSRNNPVRDPAVNAAFFVCINIIIIILREIP